MQCVSVTILIREKRKRAPRSTTVQLMHIWMHSSESYDRV